jgi:uncharacterized membrane protein HdeD (DUF308 family)
MTMSPESTPESTPRHGPADPQEILGDLGGSWLWALGLALAMLIPGILILVWPDETLHILAVIIGIQLLVAGVFRFVTAFSDSRGDRGAGGRVAAVLISVLAVLAGVLVLRNPFQTIAALSLVLGIYWLVAGMLTAFMAIGDHEVPHRGLAIAVGALGIVAGAVVLAYPVPSAVALARLLGLWFILLGLVELVVAIALRTRGARA